MPPLLATMPPLLPMKPPVPPKTPPLPPWLASSAGVLGPSLPELDPPHPTAATTDSKARALKTRQDFFEVTGMLLWLGRSYSKLIVKQKREKRAALWHFARRSAQVTDVTAQWMARHGTVKANHSQIRFQEPLRL